MFGGIVASGGALAAKRQTRGRKRRERRVKGLWGLIQAQALLAGWLYQSPHCHCHFSPNPLSSSPLSLSSSCFALLRSARQILEYNILPFPQTHTQPTRPLARKSLICCRPERCLNCCHGRRRFAFAPYNSQLLPLRPLVWQTTDRNRCVRDLLSHSVTLFERLRGTNYDGRRVTSELLLLLLLRPSLATATARPTHHPSLLPLHHTPFIHHPPPHNTLPPLHIPSIRASVVRLSLPPLH